MKTTKPTLFAIFILLTIAAKAQYFKHIGIFDGLSQTSVMAIYQDQLGRMWFGTKEGVNIYDGNDITSFKSFAENHSGIKNRVLIGNSVSAIKGSRNGDVFILADNTLLRYDLKKETFHTVFAEKCYAMTSYSGDIWCVTEDSLCMYNAEKEKLDGLRAVGPHKANWLTVTANRYYICHEKGLDVLQRKNGGHFTLLSGTNVYRTFESSDKELWIGCLQDGLYRLSTDDVLQKVPYTPHSSEGVSSHQIREFVEDAQHNIWFGTFDGLQKYDYQTGKYSLIKFHKGLGGLNHSSIFSLFNDQWGVIWVGSYYGGVNYLNLRKTIFSYYNYESFATEPTLFFSYIGEMAEDNEGGLWVATDGGGLSRLDKETSVFTNYRAGTGNAIPHNNVKSISYDAKRHCLYIGTHIGGLSRYDLKRKSFYNYQEHLSSGKVTPGNIIYHIQFWKDRLYVSSRDGFFILNPDTDTFEKLKTTSNYFLHFDLDEDGYVWATLWKELVRIDLKNPENTMTIDLLQHGCPFDITKVEVSQNGVYAGTLGYGLYFYDKRSGEMTRYTADKGQLLSDYCYNIVETLQGNLLITSDKGITMFYPDSKFFRSVEYGSGFPASAIMNGCGVCIAESGDIYVGDMKGITRFVENDLRTLNEAQQLYFSRLSVNNQHVYPADKTGILKKALPFVSQVVLKYDQNDFGVKFALHNYANVVSNRQYEYKLEGFDEQWIVTDQMSLYYTNIDPGNYILRVRYKGDKGKAGGEISLPIKVTSAWYATVWAWLFYLIFLSLLVTYYVRSRMAKRRLLLSLEKEQFEKQQIEHLNNDKLRFFTNVSHEFRTPLTLVVSYVDILLQQTALPRSLYNYILKISKHTRQMQNLVSELLDFRKFDQNYVILKVGKNNLTSFVQEIYLSFYDYAVQRNIKYRFQSDSAGLECWFDKQQMEKVFFNLLSNAFKYTPDKGSIEVAVRMMDETICVQVSDTGVGMEAGEAERVFERFYQSDSKIQTFGTKGTGIGLALTQSIVDKHHGVITVESELGKGSVFTVCLLRGKEHFVNDKNILFTDQHEETEYIMETIPVEISPVAEADNLETGERDYTVLIVEDNEELLQILKQIFIPYYKVCLARNGEEGLSLAMTEKPDLIISDIMMPEMTGTEMCVRIKNNISLCHIPVVLLTALNTTEQNIEGLNRGADDYITKPFNANILLARCNNLIRSRLLIQQQLANKPISEIDLTTINSLDKDLLKRVTAIIDKNLSDPEFDIPLLCKELGMGRTLLYSKFKALVGMTPNNFVLNYKLKYAASMLIQHPESQIAEISDRAGFNSPIYFSRCFKNLFHTSPQNYRKKQEEGS